jgi:hypothetical protein
MYATSALESSGSISLALLPLGFLVKNWKVLAPISEAVSPIVRNPFDEERWQPILNKKIISLFCLYR